MPERAPELGAGPSGAVVGVIMGSDSDWPVMSAAAEALAEFDVPHKVGVYSAHRGRSGCSTTRPRPPTGACR